MVFTKRSHFTDTRRRAEARQPCGANRNLPRGSRFVDKAHCGAAPTHSVLLLQPLEAALQPSPPLVDPWGNNCAAAGVLPRVCLEFVVDLDLKRVDSRADETTLDRRGKRVEPAARVRRVRARQASRQTAEGRLVCAMREFDILSSEDLRVASLCPLDVHL